MTSGNFHLVPLDSINVQRDDRQRRELLDTDVLADSINRLGLIHPIVITRQGDLVAGERRYTAVKSLGWTAIPVQYTDELDPAQLRAIELEENIKRQDITWLDQVNAVVEYHRLRASQTPGWGQADTATDIGLSHQHTNRLLQVAEEIKLGNKMVIEAPKLSTAVGLSERARERRDQAVLDRLHGSFGSPPLADSPQSILVEDFNEWVVEADTTPRFNLLHCDFPYGIDADTFNQSSAPSWGSYEDSRDTWAQLMVSLELATRHR